jgi:hypothetical protein
VAHTPEQRDLMNLCGAKKKNGDSCRAFAGQGTEHPGVGRCKYHLGGTKTHRTHAVRQEAQRRSIEFGQSLPVEPTEALLGVLHLSAGHLSWVREELAATDDKRSFDAQVLLRLFNDERDRVARIAKAALDAGVQERHIKLAERYGELIATVLRAIFYDPELALTAAQRDRLPDLLRRHLSGLESDRPALERGAA